VVAYFDRLVRSLKVQLEVIERVERAGGEIFALDHGKLTNGTAAQRLSTNMLGSVFQYFAYRSSWLLPRPPPGEGFALPAP
jgi:DNA invertase Pin-like site-specific DNA recombinase